MEFVLLVTESSGTADQMGKTSLTAFTDNTGKEVHTRGSRVVLVHTC